MRRRNLTTAALLLLALICGCQRSVEDISIDSYRDQFLVAAETADPISLSEAAERVASAAETPQPQSVVVIGRIYAGELEPWDPGKASFILSELPAEGHGAGHDADNCPFCKRRAAKAPTAVVQFVDDSQETIGIDARKLFGVEKGQTVVVHGTVSENELGSLILTAEKMHLR